MLRRCQRSLVPLALLAAVACGDSDGNSVKASDSTGSFTLADVSLTTNEDQPISGFAPAQGSSGLLSSSVTQQGTLGTLVFTSGTQFVYTPHAHVTGSDTVVIVASNGVKQAQATVHITITPIDDAPSLSGDTQLIMAEDSVLDIDTDNVIVVDEDTDSSQVTLTLLPSALYTATGNTLRPLADYNGSLDVFVLLYDGTASSVVQLEVTVTPVNDAPVNTVPIPQRTAVDTPFTFGGDATVSVDDVDSELSPLLVSLSADSGTLTLASTAGLTLTAGTGVDDAFVRFNGTRAAVSAALNGLRLTPPASYTGVITLTLTSNDQGATGAGGPLSDTDTFVVAFGAVDLPPNNTLPGSATIEEDTTLTFTTPNVIAVNDVDLDGTGTAAVTLDVDVGTLTLSGTTGLTFTSGNGTADTSLAFTGTLTSINAALTGMTYVPSLDYSGSATLTLETTTDTLSDTDTMIITVSPINDPPSVTGPASAVSTNVDTAFAFTLPNSLALGDVDVGTGTMQLELSATHGTVAVPDTAGVTVVTNTGTEYVATGQLGALSTAIAGVTFTPDSGFTGAASLHVVIRDNGNTGAGGAASDSQTFTIDVQAINEPPVAGADNYATSGNTELDVVAGDGVLQNDSDDDGIIVLTGGTLATTLGGSVTLSTDGSFKYFPPVSTPGNTTDGFDYTITDSDNATSQGHVTITLGHVIWYVDSSKSGDGRSFQPAASIAAIIAQVQADATIYVAAAATPYSATITLPSGASLVGSGVALDRDANPDIPASTAPTLGNDGTQPVVTMGTGSSLSGIVIEPTAEATAAAVVITGGDGQKLTNVEIRTYAPAIAISEAGAVTLDQVSSIDTLGDALTVDRTSTSATTSVTMNSCSIDGTVLGNGVLARATAGAIAIIADSLVVTAVDTNGIDAAASSSTGMVTVKCTTCTFDNDATTAIGDTAIHVVASAGAASAVDVENSHFRGWTGSAINIEGDGSGSTTQSKLIANQLDAAAAGSWQISGFTVLLDGESSDHASGAVLVDSNVVALDAAGGLPIELRTHSGAGHALHATLTSNTVSGGSSDAIELFADTSASICGALTGNDATAAADGYRLEAAGSIVLPGLTGSPASFLASQSNTGTVNATGTIVDGTTCELPTN